MEKWLRRYFFPCVFVALFFTALGVGIGLPLHEMRTEQRYVGEVVLYTPEEHQEFLEAIGKKEVSVLGDTLHISSESPVTARFEVYVPKSYRFPYGEKAAHGSAMTTMVVLLLVGVFTGFLAVTSFKEALQARREDAEAKL